MQFDILSIFPEMFESVFRESIIARAKEKGLIDIFLHNLRDYSQSKHKKVDDYPFGGGVGMVMGVEPIALALDDLKRDGLPAHTVLMCPSGNRLDQKKARELTTRKRIILICGRYEGVDERVALHYADEEISIGDYILSGGEIPAMVLVDTVTRLIPRALGDPRSSEEESFEQGLLEYPQYTRPREFRGFKTPEVLLSGNHKEIEEWQKCEALEKTARRRPDLLKKIEIKKN
jgi:tRNA (guanine37-N1)-methyltransferase